MKILVYKHIESVSIQALNKNVLIPAPKSTQKKSYNGVVDIMVKEMLFSIERAINK